MVFSVPGSEVINVVVKEDQDVLLNCALDGKNIQDDVFDWKKEGSSHEVFFYTKGSHYNNGRQGQDEAFKGRVFHFPERLAAGNASIVIRKSQVKDSGVYTCDFPFRVPIRRAQYQLVVGECPGQDAHRRFVFTEQTGSSVSDGLRSGGQAPPPLLTTLT
ncbi:unnamed protein product [Ophioblennius macclurei]